MIKFCTSVLCLIVLCMKVTAYKKFYLPNSICPHFCKFRTTSKFDKNAHLFDWETCYPTSYENEQSNSENNRLKNGCPVVPTCNDDSYVNCVCWGIYGLYVGNLTQPICKFSREEVELRSRPSQKLGNMPVKDQKKKPGQVITNTADTIKTKLNSTVNMDENILKDKFTMSGPAKGASLTEFCLFSFCF
ncbi:unnamed protein product [Macrosiphum euphorbiae]|uniref:Uncharacterized protein n=1 Tax=Macrosiphum euphorbiae TaxID=13131 RepID=A0AAV0XKY7_9HEMI|nr:unnamed protein product [Macrosiphum euphorbiae]